MNKRFDSTLDSSEVLDIAQGCHRDPFSVLGAHPLGDGDDWVVRAFKPGALAVGLISRNHGLLSDMRAIGDSGLFEAIISARETADYKLRVRYPLQTLTQEDVYRFPSILSADDLYLFHEGSHEHAYQFLGANWREIDGVQGVLFSVWAPNARRVAVVGDFNHWDARTHGMRLLLDSGVWELFVPELSPGVLYKYSILDAAGKQLPLKADPYARQMELRPGTASRVAAPARYEWGDRDWMRSRGRYQHVDSPINIYEVHLGSWRRDGDNGLLGYREVADSLVPYVREMGFSHIQLMPINEHPFGGSWGYQPVGMFAPTSRYGSADELRYLIDLAHQHEIGVLLDWVPGHFPADEHGLGRFDGTHLYEHQDERQGFHPDWKTYIYNYDRAEVVSYLLSNALYWLSEFHIDGLRFDAVASMLYLDYSRREGEWLPNAHGGRENLAAIRVLRMINSRAYARFPDVMMVAEESTAWPGVTAMVDAGGLGFGYKWNLGWMNDTLQYMQRDPIHRKYHHNEMTFGLIYAFSENFILPLSHDEVVHGKRSLLEKMPGDDWQKFANLRAYLGFMWGHPGKKLLFMGGEIAQRREWQHENSLDWHLLEHDSHAGVRRLVCDLNRFYRDHAALWLQDARPEGFEWITAGEESGAIFVFLRKGVDPETGCKRRLLVASNLAPTVYEDYRIGVPGPGIYTERLNSDSRYYGGSDRGNPHPLEAVAEPGHGRGWSIRLTLPPLATLFMTVD